MKDSISRRAFVASFTAAPLAASMTGWAHTPGRSTALPAKDEFEIKGTYLNAAYTHPMSKGSHAEALKFLSDRLVNRKNQEGYDAYDRQVARDLFAQLIRATPEEIAFIPSTMYGENMVLAGLSLVGSRDRVVTDALHFHGSLHLYRQLQQQGLDVAVVKPRDNRIELDDLAKAITPGTKLVAISLVSATTGFLHDLKAVCDLAHARGALVYADIIQAAGAVPIDVRETGVDFCATATYKWLMGDFGVGFLYVKKEHLASMKRMVIGYRQMDSFTSHVLPFDPPGTEAFETTRKEDMSGHFEVGTFANEGICALRYSLDYLVRVEVLRIQQYRQPMIDLLQRELPKFGFQSLTPVSASPIACFAFEGAGKKLPSLLKAADINISVYDHMIRVSPSFYNDLNDAERLVATLRTAAR